MPAEKPTFSQTRHLETILRHIPAAIAYRELDSVLAWANPAYLRLLGLPAERVLGRPFAESFPDQAAAFLPLLDDVVAKKRPVEHRSRPFSYAVGGETRQTYWDITYVPVMDEAGEVTGTLSLGVEVSSRIESERFQAAAMSHLQAVDRYKDEFLSVISHELRTPLNFITAFGSVLADELSGPLNPTQQAHVAHIMTGADRMLALVDDLLDAAKLQAGRLDVIPAPAPYAPLVDEVCRQLAPMAGQNGLRLVVDVRTGAVPTIDRGRLGQVLTNLVANALKFTPAGGRVTVRALERDGLLITEVADTGPGIAPEDVPKLFTRFRQLDMSATRAQGGTGLGLAISKAIVDAHGGAIGVASTPGEGSTFWVSLPLG